jgi:hypothetical protein
MLRHANSTQGEDQMATSATIAGATIIRDLVGEPCQTGLQGIVKGQKVKDTA